MSYNDKILKSDIVFDARASLPKHQTKKWDKRDPSKIIGVVYHQSLENYGTASGNAKYHVGPNHISSSGLPSLSYTLFGEKTGRVLLANDIEDKVYSQGNRNLPGDENALYLSVCWGGNFSAPGYKGSQEPTIEQAHSATKLWKHLKNVFGFTNNQLFGHYDFGKATCPGNTIGRIIETINGTRDWGNTKYDLTSSFGRQAALTELGYYKYKIDGLWGPYSRSALQEYQRASGLVPDGVWGKKTTYMVMKDFKKDE